MLFNFDKSLSFQLFSSRVKHYLNLLSITISSVCIIFYAISQNHDLWWSMCVILIKIRLVISRQNTLVSEDGRTSHNTYM